MKNSTKVVRKLFKNSNRKTSTAREVGNTIVCLQNKEKKDLARI